MNPIHRLSLLLAFISLLSQHQYRAQSSTTTARGLDALLQDYAFRAFGHHPHTGRVYDGIGPSNLTGIRVSVLRLRNGSLRKKGVASYKEFEIPMGIVIQPYVRRLALVYHNLGNWSSGYYPLPGFTYLTPLRGLLAYSASNLTATNLPELGLMASGRPILVNFTNVRMVPSGLTPKCVWFDLNGLPEFDDLVSDNVCKTSQQGHFSIVVNSTGLAPSPAPSAGPPPGMGKKHKSKAWKIVAGVVGGFVGLVLLALLAMCLCRYRQVKKVAEMERRAEVGEALRMAQVGNTQAPVASETRTQPVLENEYAA